MFYTRSSSMGQAGMLPGPVHRLTQVNPPQHLVARRSVCGGQVPGLILAVRIVKRMSRDVKGPKCFSLLFSPDVSILPNPTSESKARLDEIEKKADGPGELVQVSVYHVATSESDDIC